MEIVCMVIGYDVHENNFPFSLHVEVGGIAFWSF